MPAPALILLAGPNGSGKSTLYEGIIRPRFPEVAFINADNHERAQLQHLADPLARSEAAREWADAERARFLSERRSFATETVFSHEFKIALIEEAKAAGFEVLLLIVCCDDVDLLVRRGVARRARQARGADSQNPRALPEDAGQPEPGAPSRRRRSPVRQRRLSRRGRRDGFGPPAHSNS